MVVAATVLVVSIASSLVGGSLPARATSLARPDASLSDNFTRDAVLNPSLWQVNGTEGLNFAAVNCRYCVNVTLAPSFSSAGMEIAQIDNNSEIGTIQSIESFSPPLTFNVSVEATLSNGHPFVFGLTNANATSGVQVTGNLDPRDCSDLGNCGDPSTCGTSYNASIAPGQCFYGIYARTGSGNGTWPKSPVLYATPSVGVVYSLQIAIDSSGAAQYTVSQSGQLLGRATATVGPGPFYVIIAQSEGVPVPGPGPNQAYWLGVALTPSSSYTGPSSSSSPTSINWLLIVLVVVGAAIILGVLVAAYGRRRRLIVHVLDSGSSAPVPGAGVAAEGPKVFSGTTRSDGRVTFAGVKSGVYSLKAAAPGYGPSTSVPVSVERTTECTVKLDRAAPVPPAAPSPVATSMTPGPSPSGAFPGPGSPSVPGPAMVAAPSPASAATANLPEFEGADGWMGARIREIIETFQRKGAVSPETALTADELGLSRMFVRMMRRRRGRTRVFIETNGRYYLDQAALGEMQGRHSP